MTQAILGLGTNQGDRAGFLRRALYELIALPPSQLRVQRVSAIYESDALLPENAPAEWNQPFLNLCIRVETELSPPELLSQLKRIERAIGRTPSERWAPREIDIDVLAMSEPKQIQSPQLNLPHPGLLKRPFALLPFADLAPDWKLDDAGRTARELAEPWIRWCSSNPDQVPFRTRIAAEVLTQWMGILNLTPDSFSDGGRFDLPERAWEQAQALVQAGASILDLGAESTRPGATPVAPEEEWRRLEPVLKRLAPSNAILSVDTRHAEVARQALRLGAHWINDVSGFSDPEMIRAVRDSSADLVVMHSLSVPPRKDLTLPPDSDPLETLLQWGGRKLSELERAGIPRSRVILDPGIGFGKTPTQSLAILQRVGRLHELGARILVGHSRKSFLASHLPKHALPSERDLETGAISVHLARSGVHYLRVHEVEVNARLLRASALLSPVSARYDETP